MRLLAIETATAQSAVALAVDRDVVATTTRVDRVGHGTFLVPAIEFCLDQAGWFPDELDAIVVDVGPGLYTGMRVGIATAQGLGFDVGDSGADRQFTRCPSPGRRHRPPAYLLRRRCPSRGAGGGHLPSGSGRSDAGHRA